MALVVAGCGNGGKLAQSDLALKADAICKRATKELDALPPLTNVKDAGQAAKYFGAAKPIAERQDADLKALKPANGVKPLYAAFLALNHQATKLLSDTYAAAKAGNTALDAKLLRDLATAIGSTDRAAVKLGMKVCGGS
jgi:hypothetical protein